MEFSISMSKYPMGIEFYVDTKDGTIIQRFGTDQSVTGISEYDKKGWSFSFWKT